MTKPKNDTAAKPAEESDIVQLAGVTCKGPPGQHRAAMNAYSSNQHRIWYDLRMPHVVHVVLSSGGHILIPLANVLGMGLPREDGAGAPADDGQMSDAYYEGLRARVRAAKKAKESATAGG